MGYFGHIIGMAITLKCLKNFFSQSGEKNDFWHPLNPSGSKILKSLQKPWKNAWKGLKFWNKIPKKNCLMTLWECELKSPLHHLGAGTSFFMNESNAPGKKTAGSCGILGFGRQSLRQSKKTYALWRHFKLNCTRQQPAFSASWTHLPAWQPAALTETWLDLNSRVVSKNKQRSNARLEIS